MEPIEFKKTEKKVSSGDTFYLIVNGKNTKCYFVEDQENDGKLKLYESNIHKVLAYHFLKDLKCAQFSTEYDMEINIELPLKYGELGLMNISRKEDKLVFYIMVDIMEEEMKKPDLNILKLMNKVLDKLETNHPKNIRRVSDFITLESDENETNKLYFFSFNYTSDIKWTLAKHINDLQKWINKVQLELETEMIANIKKIKTRL